MDGLRLAVDFVRRELLRLGAPEFGLLKFAGFVWTLEDVFGEASVLETEEVLDGTTAGLRMELEDREGSVLVMLAVEGRLDLIGVGFGGVRKSRRFSDFSSFLWPPLITLGFSEMVALMFMKSFCFLGISKLALLFKATKSIDLFPQHALCFSQFQAEWNWNYLFF